MIIIATVNDEDALRDTLASLDEATRAWEMRAARGECSWICADCCSSFSDGMPDKCDHGNQWCTDIIQRDKKLALDEVAAKGTA